MRLDNSPCRSIGCDDTDRKWAGGSDVEDGRGYSDSLRVKGLSCCDKFRIFDSDLNRVCSEKT